LRHAVDLKLQGDEKGGGKRKEEEERKRKRKKKGRGRGGGRTQTSICSGERSIQLTVLMEGGGGGLSLPW
jgi:hypothetical protein